MLSSEAVTSAETQSPGGDEPAKVNYDQIADYLTDGYWEWDGGSRRAFDVAPGGTLTADITGLTAEGQQLARWALEAWTNVTDIDFQFVKSDADITFDDEEDGAFSRATNISGNQIISSHVNVSADWLDDYGSTIDSYSFSTYIHETGHALGLGHPGPYNWTATYGVDNIFPGDSWQATVMSYFDQDENTYINASYAYAVTPMITDIIAIQNLYGVPTDINAGDTVYGYESNVGGYLGQLFAQVTEDFSLDQSVTLTLTIYDTGGSDTLDGRTDTFDQRVDLRPEGISDVYGFVGNVVIARDTWIENVIAGSGNDRIIGNALANRLAGGAGNDELWGSGGDDVLEGDFNDDVLEGGAGADQLDGGTGTDTVSYAGSDRGVIVYLSEGTGKRGHAEGDVIVDVENVLGSVHGDVLGGDDGANRLSGGGGNDRLSGRGGDDVLEGGAGADRLFGGAGMDTVSYAGSDRGVIVYLSEGTVKRGDAQGDVIVNFENVLGSVHGDVLGGDDGSNWLSGGGGNDRLLGAGGDDMLEGGAGADRLFGGAGVDTVSYAGSDEAVIVALGEGTGEGGDAEGDVITNIENVIGSEYDDFLTGDDSANRLSGGDGDDWLNGGAGADRLNGGAGVDWVSYAGSDEAVTVDLEVGTGEGGDAEGDVIVNFENVLGSVHGDVLGGDDGANWLSGGGGNDRLLGGAGDDMLEGGAGADRLFGGAGVDWVSYAGSDEAVTVDLEVGTGEGGDAEGDVIVNFENVLGSVHGDVLGGGDGANRLSGGGGNDRLLGGGGDDMLEGGAGADRLFGGAGVDWVSYAGSDEAVTVDLEVGTGEGGDAEGDVITNIENVIGSEYDDFLTGDDSANRLSGGDGDDWLNGGAGADRLNGGAGVDWVSYSGSDRGVTVSLALGTAYRGHAAGDTIIDIENLNGSSYADRLLGDNAANSLWGRAGDDTLEGRAGNDTLGGGSGADLLDGGAGVDWVSYWYSDEAVTVDLEVGTGEGGHAEGDVIVDIENLQGSSYADWLLGDNAANSLWGRAGDDTLEGRAGDDWLNGGAGADRLDGGAGVDVVSYSGSDQGVVVDLGMGTGMRGHAAGDTIVDIENLRGSSYADRLLGDNAANSLWGRAGNDTLEGRAGDDWLNGGAGADRLDGGAGMDVVSYSGSDQGVVVDLGMGTGMRGHAAGDTIVDIENLRGSSYADRLLGDNAANSLWGRAGNDTLEGRAGDDWLNGGAGADRLDGGAGMDVVSYSGSDQGVTVDLGMGTGMRGHAAGDTIVDIENLEGSSYADRLLGDNDANSLWGRAGDDTLEGRAGDDWLNGGAGADRLDGGAGMDVVSYSGSDQGVTVDLGMGTGMRGHAAGDTIVDIENLEGSSYADRLLGDNAANSLWGRAGNDTLEGRAGDDILDGGPGADLLKGGRGTDTFVFRFDDGDDTISDFTDGQDRIDLSEFDLSGFAALDISTSPAGVMIDLSAEGGGTILLENFDMSDLDAGDFLFA